MIAVAAIGAAFSEEPFVGAGRVPGVTITGTLVGRRTETAATAYAVRAFARLPEVPPESGLICVSGPNGPMVEAFDGAWHRSSDGRLTGSDFPRRARRIHPFTLLRALGNGVCAGLAERFGIIGPTLNVHDQATAPAWLLTQIEAMSARCPAVVLVLTDAGARLEEGAKRRARTGASSMLEGAVCLCTSRSGRLGELSLAEPEPSRAMAAEATPGLRFASALLMHMAAGTPEARITLRDSDGACAAVHWRRT